MKIATTDFIKTSPREGKIMTRFADSELGGLKHMVVGQTELQPDTFVPTGRHDVEEVYIVTQGQASVTVGTQVFDVSAGEVVIVPPGEDHCVQNHSDGPVTYFWVASPQP